MVPGLRPEREGRGWAKFEGAAELGPARSAAELLPSPGRRPLSPPTHLMWPPRGGRSRGDAVLCPPPSARDPLQVILNRRGGHPGPGGSLDGVWWERFTGGGVEGDRAVPGSLSTAGQAGLGTGSEGDRQALSSSCWRRPSVKCNGQAHWPPPSWQSLLGVREAPPGPESPGVVTLRRSWS